MRKFFKNVFIFLFVIFSFQSFLINIYQSVTKSVSSCSESSIESESELGKLITHQRSWTNNRAVSSFCMDYSIYNSQQEESLEKRESFHPKGGDLYFEYWGNIYQYLHEINKDYLQEIEDSLSFIKQKNDLSRSEFAHLIVSFIQDIPYSYINSDDCEDIEDGKPCKGNSRFGILSPIEFLHSLKGDCDTRTVLLYSLLSNYDYEPLILISNEYLHSMLAVDIPSSGEYILHQGKKYYFWETTNKGWEPGMLAPDMKNKNYWNIALGN